IVGWMNCSDGRGRTASDQLLGKRPIPAADVEPYEIVRNVEPIQKCFGDKAAPAAHKPLIGLSIREELVRFLVGQSLTHRPPNTGLSYRAAVVARRAFQQGRDYVRLGSHSVIRRCRFNVRFARKRTWLGDFMSTRLSASLLKGSARSQMRQPYFVGQ